MLWTGGNAADALFAAGRASESVRAAAKTLPIARAMGAATNYGVYFAARGAEALAWLGRWQAARQLLGELLALDPPPGSRCRPLLTSGLLRFWQGDFDTARAELALALDGHKIGPASATCGYAWQALIAAAEHRFDAAAAAVQTGLGWCAGTDGPAHITHILAKLGVTNRTQAAAAARQTSLTP